MRCPSVCIVTSSHVAHNPRAVKEADALAGAGFRVRVVSCQVAGWIADRDRVLISTRGWQHDPIDLLPRGGAGVLRSYGTRARSRLYREVARKITLRRGIAEHAIGRAYPELRARAAAQDADLYIAHNLEALPAAHAAARARGAHLAFDSEDFHSGQFLPSASGDIAVRLVEYVEGAYLPACDLVTAPSDPVADALRARYRIPRPIVVHNVFPLAELAHADGLTKDRLGPELSLYWYSQTVGLNRGLQSAIRAIGLADVPCQLHIRGLAAPGVRSRLEQLARVHGVEDRVHFHQPVPPPELLSRAMEHDIGLALEPPLEANRQLTISNKLFMYLLAGLAVLASDVEGQRLLMDCCPGAGYLHAAEDDQKLAEHIRALSESPSRLRACKNSSALAARRRWNWERERGTLVRAVGDLLVQRNRARRRA